MKVAFLTPEYPHPKTSKSGGIGTSIKSLSKGIIGLGHDVVVLVYGQDKDECFEEEEITIYKIKNIKIKGLSLFLTQKKVERFINKLYNKGDIDIVEAVDWTGFTSYVKPKCPVIIKLHGSDTYFCHLDGRKVKPKNLYHEKRALKNAHGIISVSNYTGELTNKLFDLEKEFEVIPNSLDINVFKPKPVGNKYQILYFGTLIRKKGLLELPLIFNEVIKQIPNAELLLVGKDASDISTGKQSTWDLMKPFFSPEAMINVNYKGVVPHDEIGKIINEAKVCVFPSFAEAFPISWLEAMAMKKPIVASNIGWANEMIEHGKQGYLIHPEEHQEFANKIIEILSDENFQKELGKSARDKVENNFDIKTIAKRNVEFYNKFVD